MSETEKKSILTPVKSKKVEFTTSEKWLVRIAVTFSIAGFLIFLVGVLLFKNGETFDFSLKVNSNKFGDLGSFISGAVGTLWTLVSVILFYITLQLQRKELSLQRDELELTREELKKSAEANKSIAEDNKAKAILDLYQAYISPDFREKRQRAWNVLRMCIAKKEYSDYVVMHFFPVFIKGKQSRDLKGELIEFYKRKMKERFPLFEIDTDDNAKESDRIDRHALDDFLNFFNLLALRKSDKEIETFKACEFYYDHWRPLLWFICDQRYQYYNLNDTVSKFSKQVNWNEMLKSIDEFYDYEAFSDRKTMLQYIKTHPILGEFEIDSQHDFMKA